MKFAVITLIGCMTFSMISPSVLAYTNTSNRYSTQKAASYVDAYVARLQRAGYSTADITKSLIQLRSVYIKREKSKLYTGSALIEIQAIIDELDSAIAGVSEGTCGTCDIYDSFNVYVPPRSYNPYNPYTPVSPSHVRIGESTLTNDSYNTTEVRTNLTRDNSSNSYKEYDIYTFHLQQNGNATNQPSSSSFMPTSLHRQFSTRQGHTIGVYFGSNTEPSTIRSIRSLANNSNKFGQTYTTIYNSLYDFFSSPSPDEFIRHAIWNGSSQRTYRTYKLYVAKDDSQAFLLEYIQTGNSSGGSYAQNITGIDSGSFSESSTYFSHTYRTNNTYTKRYKQYVYVPQSGSNPSSVQSTLGMGYRTSYQMGTTKNMYVNNTYTTTNIHGYTVNSGYISSLESTFSTYAYPSYVSLPGSISQITFSPRTGYEFQYAKLSDNTYRVYRLLVAEDGSEAYLTEYTQTVSNNYYY